MSSSEDGPSGPRANGRNSAVVAAVDWAIGEVRPPRIAKYMVVAKSELAESSGDGPSWSRAHGAASADVTAAVKSAGEDRPLGEAEYRVATKFEIAEYAGEFPTLGKHRGSSCRSESATRSGRKCEPASRFQAIQAHDDWLREEAAGEYLPE